MSWNFASVEQGVTDAVDYVETKASAGLTWAEEATAPPGGPLGDAPQDGVTLPAATDQTPSVGFFDETLSVAKDLGKAVYDELKAGPPGGPGRSTPEERDAYEQGVRDLPEKVKKKAGQLSSILDGLSNPWVLGGLAVVVGLAVLGPYVLPFIREAR